jgi:tetratricopeptide (TPR) repeat protein
LHKIIIKIVEALVLILLSASCVAAQDHPIYQPPSQLANEQPPSVQQQQMLQQSLHYLQQQMIMQSPQQPIPSSFPAVNQSLLHDALAWNDRGVALYNQSKYDEALQAFDRSVEIDPQLDGVWSNKGATLMRVGKGVDMSVMDNKAIQAFDKAIEINPQSYGAWNNKGIALNKKAEYEEATKAFDKATKINPSNPAAWRNKGIVLLYQGVFLEDAVQAFDKAIEINPQDASAWHHKGRALFGQGETGENSEAIKCLRRALEIDPNLLDSKGNLELAFTVWSG